MKITIKNSIILTALISIALPSGCGDKQQSSGQAPSGGGGSEQTPGGGGSEQTPEEKVAGTYEWTYKDGNPEYLRGSTYKWVLKKNGDAELYSDHRITPHSTKFKWSIKEGKVWIPQTINSVGGSKEEVVAVYSINPDNLTHDADIKNGYMKPLPKDEHLIYKKIE